MVENFIFLHIQTHVHIVLHNLNEDIWKKMRFNGKDKIIDIQREAKKLSTFGVGWRGKVYP